MKVIQSCHSLGSQGIHSPWNSLGQNIGVGGLSLFQMIFPTQGSNTGLLHCSRILYQLSHQRSPRIGEWVAYPFYSRSSWNRIGVSHIAGGFFTSWVTTCLSFIHSHSLTVHPFLALILTHEMKAVFPRASWFSL